MSKQTHKIKQTKGVSGLMTCTFEHEVKETTYTFKWEGPKISQEEWNKVLAFFKWTQDTTQSESQVRLFVHPTHGWRAWAFPQRAKTGMTTRELDDVDTAERRAAQRAQFSDAEGWLYFGTVHHHCTGSAFQSSVDENNEKDQDGLHITVGFIDRPQHDIHARLYLSGMHMKNMELSDFWDTSGILAMVPDEVRALLPSGWMSKSAQRQMGKAPPADTAFPEEWKANLVFEPPAPPRVIQHHSYNPAASTGVSVFKQSILDRARTPIPWDLNRAMSEVENWMRKENAALPVPNVGVINIEEVSQMLFEAYSTLSDEQVVLLDILFRNDVLPVGFIEHIDKEIKKRGDKELETQKQKQSEEGGDVTTKRFDEMTEEEQQDYLRQINGFHNY